MLLSVRLPRLVKRRLVDVTETREDVIARRDATRQKSEAAYNRERDYMEEKRIMELKKMKLFIGTLVQLDVTRILKRSYGSYGCKWVPAIIENILVDGYHYQVRVKGALVSQPVKRDHMTVLRNPILQAEINNFPMKTVKSMDLWIYVKTHWFPVNEMPTSNYRHGRCRSKCPCRLAGHGCSTKCHPAHYKNYPCCDNYKNNKD